MNSPLPAHTIHSWMTVRSKAKKKSKHCGRLDRDISICSEEDIQATGDRIDSDLDKLFNEIDKHNNDNEYSIKIKNYRDQ